MPDIKSQKPLLYIFNLSLLNGIFFDELNIAQITPIFKDGDNEELGNYRPISVLSCFSKVLERVMYNRLFNHLTKRTLYPKQFPFQTRHFAEHVIIQLVNQLSKNFGNNEYTIDVFIDFSKTFDTADHDILMKKSLHIME